MKSFSSGIGRKLTILATALSVSILITGGAALAQEQSKADKAIESGQRIFDNENYVQAEKTFKRALVEVEKEGDGQKKLNVLMLLGKAQLKGEKYPDAKATYEQAVAFANTSKLDAAPASAALSELSAVYRPIDWSQLRSDVSKFMTEIGTQLAYATHPQTSDAHTHVEVAIGNKYQRSVDELYKEYAPASAQTDSSSQGTVASASADGSKGASQDGKGDKSKENPVKAIKLDKKVSLDIVRESDQKYRVKNIDGVYANVGLWVKLSEMLIAPDGPEGPYAEVTAGKFGIQKSAKVNLAADVFKQLKEGIDQVDPFVAKVPGPKSDQSSAQTPAPSTNQSSLQTPVPSTDPTKTNEANGSLEVSPSPAP